MKSWLKDLDKTINAHRPWVLIGVAAFTVFMVILLNWATGSDLFAQLFWPARNTVADVRFWSALVYGLTLVMGLPVAFMLWHWRDCNVRAGIDEQRKQVENARADTNLKMFQDVRDHAAGAFDDSIPQESREQLQIAALHQLRGFLRGEFAKSFKRPAFELLLAGHAAAMNRIGVPEVQAQLSGKSREHIEEAVAALRKKLTPIDSTRMLIIRDEAEHIFTPDFSLDGRRLDLLDLSGVLIPEKIDLSACHLFGARLLETHLNGVILSDAHFDGANLIDAHLIGANLARAHLKGANLQNVRIERASLRDAHLYNANLSGACLNDADLSGAHLVEAFLSGTSLEGAYLNGSHLAGTDAQEANFKGAYLRGALLSSAYLHGAHFEGADLCGAQLNDVNLSCAHIEGADLRRVELNGADLRGAVTDGNSKFGGAQFNAATKLGDWDPRRHWPDLTEAEREEARAPWIARGMINVDALPADGA